MAFDGEVTRGQALREDLAEQLADEYEVVDRARTQIVRCAWCPDEAAPGTDFCTPECAQAFELAELEDAGYFMTLHGHPAP